METRRGFTTRRAVLKGAAIGLGLLVTGATVAATTPPAPPAVADAPRYWFECWGPGYLIGEFSSVEEVWAAPGYMEITDVRVRFKGAGPRLLLPDEEAAIAAAERTLRRTVADPAATLLSALQLSSRTPLDRLGDSLGAAGAAAVVAALELHPEAPQAGLLRHWLQS